MPANVTAERAPEASVSSPEIATVTNTESAPALSGPAKAEAAPPVVDVPWNEPPDTPPVAVESEALERKAEPLAEPAHHAAVVEVNEPDDDEPPLTDEDYFEVETQAEAYLGG